MTTTPAPSISVFLLAGTATGPFPTGWKYGAAEDVRAYLELAGERQPDLTADIDFTLTGATPTVDGGTVTLADALVPASGWADGDRLVLYRRTAKRQALALPDTEGHKPRSTEQALDKLMRTAEEAADQLDLAVRAPVGETGPTLAPAALRDGNLAMFSNGGLNPLAGVAGQVLTWGQDGLPTPVSVTLTVNGSVASVESRVVAAFLSFAGAPPAFLRLEGYAAAGDGGDGLWKRVESDPGHPLGFQTADDLWWDYAGDTVSVAAAGAFPGGAATQALIHAARDTAIAQGKPLRFPGGTYGCTAEVDLSLVKQVILDGPVFLDFTAASVLAGFIKGAFLFIGGGSLTALPDLSANVTEGGYSLTFATAPTLSGGDWVNIYNPTDGSWHAIRPEYRAGEWAKVATVAGTAATLHWPSDDSYDIADVDVYRHPMTRIEFVGGPLTVIESEHVNLKGLAGIKLKLLVDSDFSRLRTAGRSGHAAMMVSMCLGCTGTGMVAEQHRDAGNATDYGLSVANCDSGHLHGTFHGNRHGATFSGTDEIGCVPSRRMVLEGVFSRPTTGNGSIGALGVHGNVEKSEVRGRFVGGAVNVGGNRMKYSGVVETPAIGIYASELVGLDHELDLKIRSFGAPVSPRGVIDFGGNGAAFDANTSHGGIIGLAGVEVDAPLAPVLVSIRNRGYAGGEKIFVDMRGTKFLRGAVGAVISINTVSGDAIHRVMVDGVDNPAGATWAIAATKVSGWRRSGSVAIAGDVASPTANQAVVFDQPSPRASPVVTFEQGISIGGSTGVDVRATGKSATGFTATATKRDGANFASAAVGTIPFVATVDE